MGKALLMCAVLLVVAFVVVGCQKEEAAQTQSQTDSAVEGVEGSAAVAADTVADTVEGAAAEMTEADKDLAAEMSAERKAIKAEEKASHAAEAADTTKSSE